MTDTVYQVVHFYDVDGGFGDAISQQDVVEVFASEEDAQEFVSRFSRPHVYDVPYAALECGQLEVVPMAIVPAGGFSFNYADNMFRMWWLRCDDRDKDDDYSDDCEDDEDDWDCSEDEYDDFDECDECSEDYVDLSEDSNVQFVGHSWRFAD